MYGRAPLPKQPGSLRGVLLPKLGPASDTSRPFGAVRCPREVLSREVSCLGRFLWDISLCLSPPASPFTQPRGLPWLLWPRSRVPSTVACLGRVPCVSAGSLPASPVVSVSTGACWLTPPPRVVSVECCSGLSLGHQAAAQGHALL